MSLPVDFTTCPPSLQQLAMKLTGDTVHSWPTNDQLPVVSLSIKYAILHKIGIANWILSIHASTISTSLGQLIYLIGTSSRIDVREFLFQHLLRHVTKFGINIHICFPCLLCTLLLSQHPTILSTLDVVGLKPKTIAPSFRLFQDTCS